MSSDPDLELDLEISYYEAITKLGLLEDNHRGLPKEDTRRAIMKRLATLNASQAAGLRLIVMPTATSFSDLSRDI
jgi:hypothetical protein